MTSPSMPGLAVPVATLEEAVRRHVTDGACVYLGNFGAQLFAVGHEMMRQDRRAVDLIMASGGILLDQLLGARVAGSATFAHCWSPVGPGPAWCFRRLSEGGDDSVRLRELSLGHLTAALTAGAWGVPFMPVPDLPETGYVQEDWSDGRLELVESTFGSARAVEAITVDVAFVHVDAVDSYGNATVRGPLGEALIAAQAATTVVAVAEEIVPAGELPPEFVRLPGLLVDLVVHHPGAVRPDGVAFRYSRDVAAYEGYVRAASTEEGFAAWLAEVVLS